VTFVITAVSVGTIGLLLVAFGITLAVLYPYRAEALRARARGFNWRRPVGRAAWVMLIALLCRAAYAAFVRISTLPCLTPPGC